MKILLIEDEDRSVRHTRDSIVRCAASAEIIVAGSREEALDQIENDEFDLVICDLMIPPTPDSVDVSKQHGLAVHAAAREHCPGTPTIFLTGFAEIDVRTRLSTGGVDTIFTLDKYPLTRLIRKDEVEELERTITELHRAENSLVDGCSVIPASSVGEMFDRAVRMYARTTGHSTAIVTRTLGLSGAHTCRVELKSETAAPASIFIKVLPWVDAHAEFERFNRFVPNRLAPGVFAPALTPMRSGLRKQAALVSTLAASGSVSLFERMRTDPLEAAATIGLLEEALAVWRANPTVKEVRLGDLRRQYISDEKLRDSGVDPLDWAHAEQGIVPMKSSIAHGDLHGENVLVADDGRPLMIDFGDVGEGFAVTDPVVLETSLLFHRNGPLRDEDLTGRFGLETWLDLDSLCEGNAYAPVLRATRRWTAEVDSEQAAAALLYAHTMRQLKYGELPPNRLLALARACAVASGADNSDAFMHPMQ